MKSARGLNHSSRWGETLSIRNSFCGRTLGLDGVSPYHLQITSIGIIVDESVPAQPPRHEISTTPLPSTASFGWMPKPGDFEAAMRPLTRWGEPSAMLTVT